MDVETFYDKDSSGYDKLRQSNYFKFLNQTEAEIVKKVSKNKDTLEVGCGTGLIMEELKDHVKSITGVDLSSEMVAKTSTKGLNATKANAESLPFDDESFDVVYSFKVFAHVNDGSKVLKEASRVVKPGGWVIIEFYNRYGVEHLTALLSRRFKDVQTRYDTLSKFKAMLPNDLSIEAKEGIRIISPTAYLFSIPIISKIIVAVERFLSKTFLKYFGSYFVVICKKQAS